MPPTPDSNSARSVLPSNGVLSRMREDVESAAEMVRISLKARSPILMRYHCDCDGICAALSVYRSAQELLGKEDWGEYRKQLLIFKNSSPIYEMRSVIDDMELVRNMQPSLPPLAIMLDFSGNSESVDSLNSLIKANFKVLVVDHHPFSPDMGQVATLLVSPWVHGGNFDYSAGFIAGEIAKRIKPFEELEELQKTALVGDRSKLLLHYEEELKRKALVLDFVATSSDYTESLELYYSILKDPRNMESIYKRATKRTELVKKEAMNYAKLKELGNGFRLVLLRLDRFRRGEFPGKGKIAGEVHDEFDRKIDAPLVTLGYGDGAMHFRANAKAREAGFNANQLIAELKESMTNAIESGGGHDVAAGLRVNEGFERMVIDEIVKRVGKIGK